MSNFQDNLLIDIASMGYEGEGIANTPQGTVFVPYALVGEKVAVRVTHRKKELTYATLKKVVVGSKDRVVAPCPYFTLCGGCALQHASYDAQLKFKRELVERTLKKIGGIDANVLPTIASPRRYGYRNKLTLPVSRLDGRNVYGFYKPNSHEIVEIEQCLLYDEWATKLIAAVKEFCLQYNIAGYCSQDNTGLLRHVVARKTDNAVMVTVVINGERLPHAEKLLYALQTQLGVASLYVNTNLKRNNVILGDKYFFVGGVQNAENNICGLTTTICPASFAQVNDGIRDALYSQVLQECGQTDVAVDAYSGAGTLTSIIASRFSRVYGIEIVTQAVRDADNCAKRNGITNINNTAADCGKLLPELLGKLHNKGKSITLILDPPRKGCDAKVCLSVLSQRPQKVLYISCNAATLARDLALMGVPQGVYDINYIQPYDMFAQTAAIETLVCLTRKA